MDTKAPQGQTMPYVEVPAEAAVIVGLAEAAIVVWSRIKSKSDKLCHRCIPRVDTWPSHHQYLTYHHLGVVLNSTSRREAKRGQSTNRKGEMSRASH